MKHVTWNQISDRRQLRDAVRGAIQEASGEDVSAADPTADELIATAEAFGADIDFLRIWVYITPKAEGWTPRAFGEWLIEKGFRIGPRPTHCGYCGAFMLSGGTVKHADDCFMWRLIFQASPEARVN